MACGDRACRRIDLDQLGIVANVEPAAGERKALGIVETSHPFQIEDSALGAHAADEAVAGRRALAPRAHVGHVELLPRLVEDRRLGSDESDGFPDELR